MVGMVVEPVAMTDADRRAVLRSTAHEHILPRLGLRVDKRDCTSNIARRGRRGWTEPVDDDLVVISRHVDLAVGNQWRGKLGGGAPSGLRGSPPSPDRRRAAGPNG